MKPDDYEALVAEITASVAQAVEALPDGAVRYGRKNLWRGASGFNHQIDVSVRGPERVLLVECKYWNHRVPVGALLALQGRLDDIRPTLGIGLEAAIISKIGFQSGAQQVALHFGIHCDLVRSAQEFGFKYAGSLVVQPRLTSVKGSATIGAVVIGELNAGGGS